MCRDQTALLEHAIELYQLGASTDSQVLLAAVKPLVLTRLVTNPALLREQGLEFGLAPLHDVVCALSLRKFLQFSMTGRHLPQLSFFLKLCMLSWTSRRSDTSMR